MSVLTATRRKTRLDDLGFVGRGKSRHRPRNDASLYGGDYPFFQTGDVKAANLYLTEYTQTFSKAGLAQSKMWVPGTLCITIAANIAETAILGIPGCFPDSVVGFIADPAKADVRFIKYYIDTIKLRMQNISHGATQDNLSLDKLLTFDFAVPDLPTQRRIAGILSAYGDFHMAIWSGGEAWQNQRVAKFRSKGEIGNNLLFHVLQSPIQHFNATITGTTVAHLGDKHIRTIDFAAPPSALLRKASEALEPLAHKALNLRLRNQTLRQTRDLLLPKILSQEAYTHV